MTQIVAFASLFLGLVVGVQPVEVVVAENVASVELRLDGKRFARLDGEPWTARCDFGRELRPHLLEAVAHDADGNELARSTQWINMPRAPAEASIVLSGGENGRGVNASLTWESVGGVEPTAILVAFDGRPLRFSTPDRISLPAHDPEQLHFLRAELVFSEHYSSVAEVAFGGTYSQEVNTELTAVPISTAKGAKELPAAGLDGRFLKRGDPLRVVAVDNGPAELVVVRDVGAMADLDDMSRRWRTTGGRSRRQPTASLRYVGKLRNNHRLQFLSPIARPRAEYMLFPGSPGYTHEQGGVYWLLVNARPGADGHERQRLADAVAVAAMNASGSNHRRAVILLLGRDPVETSQLEPAEARRYLEYLRVPLYVWTTAPPGKHDHDRLWGEVGDVSTLGKLEREMKAVSRDVERQRIVWLDGLHLPQEIALAPGSDGVDLVQ